MASGLAGRQSTGHLTRLESLRRGGPQGRLAGDVYPRVDAELAQDMRDVGGHGPTGKQQLGGDLRVGQPFHDERGDLGLGRGEAVPAAARLPVLGMRAPADPVGAEPCLQPGYVGGGAERGVDLHGPDERGPCLVTVLTAEELRRAASSALADSSGRPASAYRSAAVSSPAVSCSSKPRQYSAFACRCGVSEPSARLTA